MSDKKVTTKTDIIFENNVIELRSVFSKNNIKYYIPPCRDKHGRFAACVKKTTKDGDLILSLDERNDYAEGKAIFFPEDHVFTIYHGKTYHMDKLEEKAEWEAIKNCPLIAKSRDEKDKNGNFVIDGEKWNPNKITKTGIGELYIYRPGLASVKNVNRRQLINKAENYIFEDEHGAEGRLKMARILGKHMENQPDADVTDFLIRIAEKEPQKIINLYQGVDTALRLLFIDAKEKKVIYIKNKIYLYGDNIVLGATDDAVIAWMQDSKNKKILELIKKDTYPEYYEKKEIN